MISQEMYADYLKTKGTTLGEFRKSDSAMIMNATFTGDTGYKRVYILDPKEGWHWTDAKYSEHTAKSILKDDVDYYLQFRPYEHHPIGTYVFIADDNSPDIGFFKDSPKDPFQDENFDEIFKSGKLWLIIDRDKSKDFVRYYVLQCNWNFKWINQYKGKRKILNVYGMNRARQSYTSWKSFTKKITQLAIDGNIYSVFLLIAKNSFRAL